MIFCFSGTGNSRYVADALADRLKDEVISLNDVIKYGRERSFTSQKPYAVVAPIYAWRYPDIVEEFLLTAKLSGCRDIYFLATMGENSGRCDAFLEKLARDRGMRCMGFRGLVMPNNYVVSSPMKPASVTDAIIERALPQIDEIAAAIREGKSVHKTDKTFLGGLMSGAVHNGFTKLMKSSERYAAGDACVSCGKCASLCVMNNITVNPGEKPVFGKNCINCFACLQYCPTQAINIPGKTEKHGRYTCKVYSPKESGK